MKTFNVNRNKGFKIKLPNGVFISTQFGYCSYGDNYDGYPDKANNIDTFEYERNLSTVDSNKAEVAIIMEESGAWLTEEYMKQSSRYDHEDQVLGYVEIDEWLEIFDWARNYDPTNKRDE